MRVNLSDVAIAAYERGRVTYLCTREVPQQPFDVYDTSKGEHFSVLSERALNELQGIRNLRALERFPQASLKELLEAAEGAVAFLFRDSHDGAPSIAVECPDGVWEWARIGQGGGGPLGGLASMGIVDLSSVVPLFPGREP